MDWSQFMRDFRRVAWIDHYSPAARRAFSVGGGTWLDWNSGQVRRLLYYLEVIERTGLELNGRKNKGFIPNIKFVDLELTSVGKAEFKSWGFTDDDCISYLERMGTEGYKIGARYDRSNGTWIASLTCADEKQANYGWCLSARGRSWLHAFAVLAYKDVVLLAGNWGSVPTADDNDAGWG